MECVCVLITIIFRDQIGLLGPKKKEHQRVVYLELISNSQFIVVLLIIKI